MHPKHFSRELTLQALFQTEFINSIDFREFLNLFHKNSELPKEALDYSETLIHGVLLHKNEIDQMIEKHSLNWKVSRMTLVDKNILRVAIYEFKFMSPPLDGPIAIDEAVQIARKYGNTDSSQFVNGLLDRIFKS